MFKLLVAYSTYDGHTAASAERIASITRIAECAVEVCDLERMQPERPLADYVGLVDGGKMV